MHTLAQELNSVLENTAVGRMLSDLGERLYFPKGIIAQGAEAKKLGKKANGTIGTAIKNGKPLILQSIQNELPNLTSSEAVGYAPTAGNPELQKLWKEEMIRKNPTLSTKTFSMPVVTPGLTAGISYLCDLFLSEGDVLLAADPAWDNYVLITEARRNATFKQFSMFKDGGFNLDAFKKAIKEQSEKGKVIVLLNCPQNPSGYSLTKDESKQVRQAILELAESGKDVMVWCDDAYFGLFYEDNIEKESLFAFLADMHERVVAVKIDGPTKEDFVWGFRTGFITFSCKGMTEEQYAALNKKVMGTIRSSVSCCATPSQTLMVKAMKSNSIEKEKNDARAILENRYKLVKKFVNGKKNHPVLEPLPFNSGYFMCFHCNGISAEALRQKLLNEYQIGTISIDDAHLRVAFSSLDDDLIEEVYSSIYKAAEELAK